MTMTMTIKVKFKNRQNEIEYKTDINSIIHLYCTDKEIEYIKNKNNEFIYADNKINYEALKI